MARTSQDQKRGPSPSSRELVERITATMPILESILSGSSERGSQTGQSPIREEALPSKTSTKLITRCAIRRLYSPAKSIEELELLRADLEERLVRAIEQGDSK